MSLRRIHAGVAEVESARRAASRRWVGSGHVRRPQVRGGEGSGWDSAAKRLTIHRLWSPYTRSTGTTVSRGFLHLPQFFGTRSPTAHYRHDEYRSRHSDNPQVNCQVHRSDMISGSLSQHEGEKDDAQVSPSEHEQGARRAGYPASHRVRILGRTQICGNNRRQRSGEREPRIQVDRGRQIIHHQTPTLEAWVLYGPSTSSTTCARRPLGTLVQSITLYRLSFEANLWRETCALIPRSIIL